MMKNIRSLNKSPLHSSAFSSPIEVRDADNQAITSVQGVGLVVKNKFKFKNNNRRIINNMVESLIGNRRNNYRLKQSLYNNLYTENKVTPYNNTRGYNHVYGHHLDQIFRMNNSTPSPDHPDQIFRIHNSTPGPGQRIRTWRPNLVGGNKRGSLLHCQVLELLTLPSSRSSWAWSTQCDSTAESRASSTTSPASSRSPRCTTTRTSCQLPIHA